MLLKFFYEFVAGLVFPLLAEYYSGLNHHAADIIGHTGDGALYYGGVSHQGALYLERTDTVATRLDNIVDTTFEPVVAVLIAPCHIACVVDAIVPCLAGLLLIAIVTLEQTDRLLVANADYNLSLFTILAAGAIGTQQIDVVLSVRDTHTAPILPGLGVIQGKVPRVMVVSV